MSHSDTEMQRDRRIRDLQCYLDVEAIKLSQLPVGTLDWRLQRQRVRYMQERLHQLRLERMTGP
jgi:hypothetical protein